YSALERLAIAKSCRLVFCRDDLLAEKLRRDGIDARSHGNIMLDTVVYASCAIGRPPHGEPLVGILPGSRSGTAQTFAVQWEALRAAARGKTIHGVVALAPGVDAAELARA